MLSTACIFLIYILQNQKFQSNYFFSTTLNLLSIFDAVLTLLIYLFLITCFQ